jgi:hypothetical protein
MHKVMEPPLESTNACQKGEGGARNGDFSPEDHRLMATALEEVMSHHHGGKSACI